jgi:membrane protease subunit (stomatin/prohibitin family)
MSAYQTGQEYNGLRWGTIMPITVMVGSAFVQLRARGNFSAIILDPTRLAAEGSDPEDLIRYLGSLVVSVITDVIGERSGEVSDVAQLTAITPQTIQAFQTKLESKFETLGLRLKDFSIDAIESL